MTIPTKMHLTDADINLFREYFDVCHDHTAEGYMNKKDYKLAVRLYEYLNMRVPHRYLRGAGLPVPDFTKKPDAASRKRIVKLNTNT